MSVTCKGIHCQQGPCSSHARVPTEGQTAGCQPSSSSLRGHREVPVPLTHGEAVDRLVSSRRADAGPRPCNSPTRTPKKTSARVPRLRIWLQETPVQLATCRGLAPSTLHRILPTAQLNQLSQVDRTARENQCVVTRTAPPVGGFTLTPRSLATSPMAETIAMRSSARYLEPSSHPCGEEQASPAAAGACLHSRRHR